MSSHNITANDLFLQIFRLKQSLEVCSMLDFNRRLLFPKIYERIFIIIMKY